MITWFNLLNRKHLLALLTIVLGWILHMWPYVSGTQIIPHGAVFEQFPSTSFVIQSLMVGQGPYWNPYIYSGHPNIGDPEALIYSPLFMTLMLIGPKSDMLYWYNIVISLHILMGGIGFYLLMRSMKFDTIPSVVGAILFMFGGSALSRLHHVPLVIPYMYFPLAWLFLKRLLDNPNWRDMVAFGVFAGAMALHCTHVALINSWILIILPIIMLLGREDKLTFVRARIYWLAGGGLISFVVLLPQLYGSLLFLPESSRADLGMVPGIWYLWPYSLATIILPDLFGYLSGPSRGDSNPAEGGMYIGGIAVIILVYWGLWRGLIWQRRAAGFIVMAIFGITFMLGKNSPVYPFLHEWVPGFDLYRRPMDGAFFLNIGLAGLVVAVLDQALKCEKVRHQVFLWAGRIVLLLCLVALIEAISEAIRRSDVPTILSYLGYNVLWLGGSVIVVALSMREAGWRRNALLVILIGFQVVNLKLVSYSERTNVVIVDPESGRYSVQYAFFHSMPNTADQEVLDFIYANTDLETEENGPYRVEVLSDVKWRNAPYVYKYHTINGKSGIHSSRYDAITTNHGSYADVAANLTKIRPSYNSGATDFLSLKYVIINVRFDITDLDPNFNFEKWPMVKKLRRYKVYENTQVLPRVLLLTDYWEVCSRDESKGMLSNDPQWPYARSAVIELPQNECRLRHVSEPSTGKLFAKIERYENMRVDILVENSQPALLVLNDVLMRGWKAYVDGVEQPIYFTNHAFRGVKIPPGTRRVTFRFRPFHGDVIRDVLVSSLR